MKAFLELVADDLRSKLSDDFSHVALIFPNKRAHLFFLEYLARTMQRPVWAPAALSISELFQQMSPLQSHKHQTPYQNKFRIRLAISWNPC